MARKKRGRPLNGWVIVNKPIGRTSTQVLGKVKFLLKPQKAGHAGTLDPLADGVLPIALGEATKTIPYVVDSLKAYRFTVRWGQATDTDDAEGDVIETSDLRPTKDQIIEALKDFDGEIQQTPPKFSAIKIDGKRAYDLAREGKEVEIKPREVWIEEASLIDMPDDDHAEFEVVCGKGFYVRSMARDIAKKLGTCGHISALKRTFVGPFDLEGAVTLEQIEQMCEQGTGDDVITPLAKGLDDIPSIELTPIEAQRMKSGGQVSFISRHDAERLEALQQVMEETGEDVFWTRVGDTPIAIAQLNGPKIQTIRVLNM